MTTLVPTLYSRTFPHSNPWLRDATVVALGTIFVAVFAQLKIALPFTPVPLTGQTFAVLLIGATLGAKRGAASMLLYLAAGGLGLPVFAGGASGLAYLSGATLGYLVGFVIAAFVIGRLAERGLEREVSTSILPFLVGTLVIYVCGVAWLAFVLGSIGQALVAGVLPFLLGDTLKIIAAALVLPGAWKIAGE